MRDALFAPRRIAERGARCEGERHARVQRLRRGSRRGRERSIAGRTKKLCEECADVAREEAEIAEQSESVVQDMMGFKGRR